MSTQQAQNPESAPETIKEHEGSKQEQGDISVLIKKSVNEEDLKTETESKTHLVEGEIFSTSPSTAVVDSEVLQISTEPNPVSVKQKQDDIVTDEYQNDQNNVKLDKETNDEQNVAESAKEAHHENVIEGVSSNELKNDSEIGLESKEIESQHIAGEQSKDLDSVSRSLQATETAEKSLLVQKVDEQQHSEEISTIDDNVLAIKKVQDEEDLQTPELLKDDGIVVQEVIQSTDPEHEKEVTEIHLPSEKDNVTIHEQEKGSFQESELVDANSQQEDNSTEIELGNEEPSVVDHTVVQTTVDDLREKAQKEDEEAKDDHLGSSEEFVIEKSNLESETKKQEGTSTQHDSEYQETKSTALDQSFPEIGEKKLVEKESEENNIEEASENTTSQPNETAHEEEAVQVGLPSEKIIQEDQVNEDGDLHSLVEEETSKGSIEGTIHQEQHSSTDGKPETMENEKLDEVLTIATQKEDEAGADYHESSNKNEAITDGKTDNDIKGEEENAENVVQDSEIAIEAQKLVEEHEDVESHLGSSIHHPIDERLKDKLSNEETEIEENAETKQTGKDDEGPKDDLKGIYDESEITESQLSTELQKEDQIHKQGQEEVEFIDQDISPSKVDETKPEENLDGGAEVQTEKHQSHSKVEETKPEENLDEAAEVHTEKDTVEADEKETVEIGATSEKIKEKDEEEIKDIDSFVEDATTESYIEDEQKQEQERSIEEKPEITKDETEKIKEEDEHQHSSTSEKVSQVDDDTIQIETKPEEIVEDPEAAKETEKIVKDHEDGKEQLDSSKEDAINDSIAVTDKENIGIIQQNETEQISEGLHDNQDLISSHKNEIPEIEQGAESITESQPEDEKTTGEETRKQGLGEVQDTDEFIVQSHELSKAAETTHNLDEAAEDVQAEAIFQSDETAHETETADISMPNDKIRDNEEGKEEKDLHFFVDEGTAENFPGEQEQETSKEDKYETPKTEEAKIKDDVEVELGKHQGPNTSEGITEIHFDDAQKTVAGKEEKREDIENADENEIIKEDEEPQPKENTDDDRLIEDVFTDRKVHLETKESNEIGQVPKSSEEDGTPAEHPKGSSEATESIDENIPIEEEKFTEKVTATLHGEAVHDLDHAYVKTVDEDTAEEIKETSKEAHEEFESTHEPEKQEHKSTAQAQNFEKVETKADENPEAGSEIITEKLDIDTPSEELTKKDEEVAHVEEGTTKSSLEDGIKKEQEIVTERKFEVTKDDETENIDKEEEATGKISFEDQKTANETEENQIVQGDENEDAKEELLDSKEHAINESTVTDVQNKEATDGEENVETKKPIITEQGYGVLEEDVVSTSRKGHAEEGEDSIATQNEEIATEQDYTQGLALAEEHGLLEHEDSSEKTEEKGEDRTELMGEASQKEQISEHLTKADESVVEPLKEITNTEEKDEDKKEIVEEASEKEQSSERLIEADENVVEPLKEISTTAEPIDDHQTEHAKSIDIVTAAESQLLEHEHKNTGSDDLSEKIEKKDEDEKDNLDEGTITEMHQDDETNKEPPTNTGGLEVMQIEREDEEEIDSEKKHDEVKNAEELKTTVDANETEKVSENPEKTDEQVAEQPREAPGVKILNDMQESKEEIDGEKSNDEMKNAEELKASVDSNETEVVSENPEKADQQVAEHPREIPRVKEPIDGQEGEEENDSEINHGEMKNDEELKATADANETEMVSENREKADQQVAEQPREVPRVKKPIDEQEGDEEIYSEINHDEMENAEELKATADANETEMVSQNPEKADQQVAEQPREVPGVTEPIEKQKGEEKINSEIKHDEMKNAEEELNANETEMVPKKPEMADQQVAEQPREVPGVKKPIDEQPENIETVTPASDLEEVHGSDYAATHTGDEDSSQKIEKEDETERDVEEVILREINPPSKIDKEEETNAEDKLEVNTKTNELEKISENPEKADQHDQVIEHPREESGATEPTDERIHQNEQDETFEIVPPAFESEETVTNAENDDVKEKVEEEHEGEKEYHLSSSNEDQDKLAHLKNKGLEEADQAISFQQSVENPTESETTDKSIQQETDFESLQTVIPVVAESQEVEQQDIQKLKQTSDLTDSIDKIIDQKEKAENNEIATHGIEKEETRGLDQGDTQTEDEASIQKVENGDEEAKHPEGKIKTEDVGIKSDKVLEATEEVNETGQNSEDAGLINQTVTSEPKEISSETEVKDGDIKTEYRESIEKVPTVFDSEETHSSDHSYTKTETEGSEQKVHEVLEQTAEKSAEHPQENLGSVETTDTSIFQKENEDNAEKVVTVLDSQQVHGSDNAYTKTDNEVNRSSTAIAEDELSRVGADDFHKVVDDDQGFSNPTKENSLADKAFEEIGREEIDTTLEDSEHKEEQPELIHGFTETKEIKNEQKDDQYISNETSEAKPVASENLESKPESNPRDLESTETVKEETPKLIDPTDITLSRDYQENHSATTLQDEYVILEADDTKQINAESKIGNITPEVEQIKKEQEAEDDSQNKNSLSDLFQTSVTRATQIIHEDPTPEKTEDAHGEKGYETIHDEHIKTEEEHEPTEDAGDEDNKVPHKKHPHNLLSGVGSKMKHSLDKVKKAITGKSSQSKPKSPT